ncbi:MAG: hypothetical protein ABSF83_07465 [Nitrososphaerales archaeon]|jgi:hypothetical protein
MVDPTKSGVTAVNQDATENELVASASQAFTVSASDQTVGVVGVGQTGVAGYGAVGPVLGGAIALPTANPNLVGVSGTTRGGAGTGVQGTSTLGAGVKGTSDLGAGMLGSSSSGTGVEGDSDSGVGVAGTSKTADAIHGDTASAQHAGVSGNNTSSGYGVYATSSSGTGVYAKGGSLAAEFDGDVKSSGNITAGGNLQLGSNGTVTAHDVILTGSDLAENFDLTNGAPMEPGSVLVIGDDGSLDISRRPYDRRVAGVVSGAYRFSPAIVMGRNSGQESGAAPIALVGRVYCKADADFGAIEVGDMLTTSATPGHAMKATDPSRAFGCVIGKALGTLESGQGLVPILVALQ